MLQKYAYRMMAILLMGQLIACKKEDIAAPTDRTLVPRKISEFIHNNYDFSILYAALVKTQLLDSVDQTDVTFFAPDNNAYNYMGIASPDAVASMDTDSLRYALLGHLLHQRIYVSQFPVQIGTMYTAASGRTMYVSVSGANAKPETRTVYVNGSAIINDPKRNLALANGVVHVMRKPLQYHRGTVQDYLAADKNMGIFVTAMKHFGFWDGLKTQNPVTVFALRDQAFIDRGITADSINLMDTAAFRRELFGIYNLDLGARRIFSCDGVLVDATYNGDNGARVGKYSIAPLYAYNGYGSGSDQATISMRMQDAAGTWGYNADGASSPTFENYSVRNADHLTENGVVHAISEMLLYPQFLKK